MFTHNSTIISQNNVRILHNQTKKLKKHGYFQCYHIIQQLLVKITFEFYITKLKIIIITRNNKKYIIINTYVNGRADYRCNPCVFAAVL